MTQLTPQEYYEQAVEYIANQEQRCVDPDQSHCVYENEEGNRCVVGQLIPDGHKALKYGSTIGVMIRKFPDLKKQVLPSGPPGQAEMLATKLQALHDLKTYRQKTGGGLSSPGWRMVRHIAKDFDLKPYVPESVV